MALLRFLFFTLSLLSASETAFGITYFYTGPPYTEILQDENPPAGSYELGQSVTGYMTLSAPLAPNLSEVEISDLVVDFEFNDGRNTISKPAPTEYFQVTTNSYGELTGWYVIVAKNPIPVLKGDTVIDISLYRGVGDNYDFNIVRTGECVAPEIGDCTQAKVDSAANFGDGGEFIMTRQVPIPVPLFAHFLLGIFVFRCAMVFFPAAN